MCRLWKWSGETLAIDACWILSIILACMVVDREVDRYIYLEDSYSVLILY